MTTMGAEICARLDELAEISAEPGALTRVFLSPELMRANHLCARWMQAAGMATHIDAIGNVVGRYEGTQPGLPALMLGSHLDTVRNAGRYDGMLGVVTAIMCVEQLFLRRERLPFAIEIVGFADEEGTRYGVALLGSRALAGTFDYSVLDRRDDAGISMRDAMTAFGLDAARIATAARDAESLLAYVELHIEQGPVLEAENLPVGCVTSISGATRLRVTVDGHAGHAGTVPMAGRQDALAAAAEGILAVERLCSGVPGLVGTVGRVEAYPSAVNVIPSRAVFTVDIRAPDDEVRERKVGDLIAYLGEMAGRRGVSVDAARFHDNAAVACAPWVMRQIETAIEAQAIPAFRLASGAGHDGMAMHDIADIGMIFVRCAGGISHNPAESITAEDAEIGARVLLRFIEDFRTRES